MSLLRTLGILEDVSLHFETCAEVIVFLDYYMYDTVKGVHAQRGFLCGGASWLAIPTFLEVPSAHTLCTYIIVCVVENLLDL